MRYTQPLGKAFVLFLLLMFYCVPDLHAQWLWDIQRMQKIKSELSTDTYSAAFAQLRSEADRELKRKPYSVTFKAGVAPSGDKHDYVSLSRYWWPNPDTPDRLPYVYKDGVSNPELNDFDRNTLGSMCGTVNTLSLAYFYTGNEKYARKAVQILEAWFISPKTRMNPHLEYAQFIPGRNNSKGRPEGLIDSYSFVEMVNSVQLIKGSRHYTPQLDSGLKEWFRAFALWFQTSEQGIKEEAAKNNHATSYDAQLVCFFLFVGDTDAAKAIVEAFPEKRIFTQIAPDGTQPHELWRTLAFHYSHYNLSHMIDIGAMAQRMGLPLLEVSSADGRSFYKAMEYLTSFLGKDVSSWPYKQISGWEDKQQDICYELTRLMAMNAGRDGYPALIKRFSKTHAADRTRLLYGALD